MLIEFVGTTNSVPLKCVIGKQVVCNICKCLHRWPYAQSELDRSAQSCKRLPIVAGPVRLTFRQPFQHANTVLSISSLISPLLETSGRPFLLWTSAAWPTTIVLRKIVSDPTRWPWGWLPLARLGSVSYGPLCHLHRLACRFTLTLRLKIGCTVFSPCSNSSPKKKCFLVSFQADLRDGTERAKL